MTKYLKLPILFSFGGTLYHFIEVLWRGYSYFSMFIVGGLCFLVLGLLNQFLSWDMGIVWQSLVGAGLVIIIEFISGLILNIWLGLNIWDYSDLPYNLLGQVCLYFYFLWIPLSCFGVILDDYLRYYLFNEKKPHYSLI